VPLVQSLGTALDDDGFVVVDPTTSETSVPGIYAAGDLITAMQGAVLAAAAAVRAAAMLNVDLAMDLDNG
jgi:thioredoxin reductase